MAENCPALVHGPWQDGCTCAYAIVRRRDPAEFYKAAVGHMRNFEVRRATIEITGPKSFRFAYRFSIRDTWNKIRGKRE